MNIDKYQYGDFSPSQRKKIESLGREAFNGFKLPENIDLLRRLINRHNPTLQLKIPNEDYIEKNVTDIEWVLDGPGRDIKYWSPQKRKKLELVKTELLEDEIVLYHENDEWSVANLFDNNIKLWVNNINYCIDEDARFVEDLKERDDNITNDRVIDVFFNYESSTDDLTYAQESFLVNILVDFESAKKVVMGTYEKGTQVEEEFIEKAKRKFGEENVKVFASKGGVIDMTGVDLCVYDKDGWKPVQVKNSKSEAERNIPKGGFSVYKSGNKFYRINEPEPKRI